jgi:cobalt-zinc-cadmium efflux system protein
MLLVAAVGLAVNLFCMRLLAGDAEKSLNVKGAYLEVWADALTGYSIDPASAAGIRPTAPARTR